MASSTLGSVTETMETPTCSEATLSDNSYYRVSSAAGTQQSSPWQRFQKTDWCREKFRLSSCPACSLSENEMKIKTCFSFSCYKICCWLPKGIIPAAGKGAQKGQKANTQTTLMSFWAHRKPFPSKLQERTFPFSTTAGNHTFLEAVLSLKSTLFYPEELLINISQGWDTFLVNFKARHTAPRKWSNTNHTNAL